MARKKPPIEPLALRPLTALQHEAVDLFADGASDERVAAELAVPLDWVRSLQGNLPVAAAVVDRQWRKHRAHSQRIRSLVEKALDVVEQELTQRPTPDLAVAILRSLKVEAPLAPLQSAEAMLRAECTQQAEIELTEMEAREGLGYGRLSTADVQRKTVRLFDAVAADRLNAPEDPPAPGAAV